MTSSLHRRRILTVLLVLVAALAVFQLPDRWSSDYAEAGLKRAVVAFALARGLNAAISVVQETELSLQPGGVGVTVLPGQLLDPVNDLIERFSWVMLLASVSLGMQDLFADVFASLWINLLLAGWIGWQIVRLWRQPELATRRWLRPLLVVLLIRFMVPLSAAANELFFSLFLQSRYDQSVTVLTELEGDVEKMQVPVAEVGDFDDSMLGRARQWLSHAGKYASIGDRVAQLQERINQAIRHIVDLLVIFLVQTVVLPLGFLWGIWQFVRRMLDVPAKSL